MAGYDFYRNGGYKAYDSPGYYAVIGSPPKGRRHAAVGYNVQSSYVTKAEEVVEYRRVMGTANNKHSPRKELFKDYVGDKPFLVSESADDYSPRYNKGSPRNNVYKDSSPRSGDYYRPPDYGKYNKFSNDDEDDDDDSDEYDIVCDGDVCYRIKKGGAKPNHLKEEGYDKEKPKGYDYYSRPVYAAPASTQPKKDTSYDKSYPDNNNKHKGNGYAAPAYAAPASTQPKKDSYYDKNEKQRGSDYVPPSYNVRISTPPKKDTYYGTSYNDDDDLYKGNGYAPTSYNDTYYYETPDNRPPPIKTRPDTSRGENKQFNASPRKDQGYQEVIDGEEARRRYGKPSSGAGASAEEKKNRKTIDAREAAKKYNGVFVSK